MAKEETRLYYVNKRFVFEDFTKSLKMYIETVFKNGDIQFQENENIFIIQAKEKGTLKTVSGMRITTIIRTKLENNVLSVTQGQGKWNASRGLGMGIGMAIFWPTLVTTGIGAYQQSRTTNKVFDYINSFINNLIMDGSNVIDEDYIKEISYTSSERICSNCSKPVSANVAYCTMCGSRVSVICSYCGTENLTDNKFCKNCGKELLVSI